MNESTTGFDPLRLADSITEEQIIAGWRGEVNSPAVSIVCHTYNHAAYLVDAIEGFLSQRAAFPFEILIHDDASTDTTTEIIERYASRFPTIISTILQKDNQFSQGHRPPKFTFPRARGRYIALCEGDDYWIDPLKLAKQVALLENHPSVNLCVHPANRVDLNTGMHSVLGDHGKFIAIKDVADVIEGDKHYAPTASYVMRTEAAMDMPRWFFDDPLPYGDFFIEAILGRKGILFIPDVMSVYRLGVQGSHSARAGNRTLAQMFADYRALVAAVNNLRASGELPDASIEIKLWRIRSEYARLFLKKRAYKEYSIAAPTLRGDADYFRFFAVRLAALSRPGFAAVYCCGRVLAGYRSARALAFKSAK